MSTTRRPPRRRRSEASPAAAVGAREAGDRRIARGDFSEISFQSIKSRPPNASLPRRFCSSGRLTRAFFQGAGPSPLLFLSNFTETKDFLFVLHMMATSRRQSRLCSLSFFVRLSTAIATAIPSQQLFISIEGNIGAGKSTVMRALHADYVSSQEVAFVDEPVDRWIAAQTSEGTRVNLLEAMYSGEISNPTFQLMALATRVGPVIAALRSNRIVIAERSIWSDKTVFAENGLKDAATRAAYELAHASLSAALPSNLRSVLILLDVPIETALKRITQRGRPEEKSIDGAYLKLLEEGHARLAKLPMSSAHVVRVDATRPIAAVVESVRDIIARELVAASGDETGECPD